MHTCQDANVHGHLVLGRARIRNYLGQWTECLALAEGLLEDGAATRGNTRLRAQAHVLSEWCCSALGLPQRAAHEAEAERLLTELDDSIGLGNLYLNVGVTAWQECRVADAVSALRAASSRYQRAGYVVGAALADNNLGEILTVQFRLEAAESLLTRASRVLRAADYPNGLFMTISGLSRILAWRGQVEQAAEMQYEALDGFRTLGAVDYVADSLLRLVEIHVLAGNADAALSVADEAASSLASLGEIPVLPAILARLRGQARVLAGRPQDARLDFERARSLAERDASPYELGLAEIGLGRIDRDQQFIDSGLARLAALEVLAPPPGL